MSAAGALVVFVVGIVAGLINSVAGGGTLLSFPTLVWLGRDPVLANVTNTVALWPGSLTGMLGFRRDLRGGRPLLVFLAVPTVLGGMAGAALLLHTPSATFGRIVPWLILFATVLFAAQGPIMRALPVSPLRTDPADPAAPLALAAHPRWAVGAVLFQFAVAVYGGYFGAGMGIITLAALGLLGITDIFRMNGLKNALVFAINAVAAAYFVLHADVRWDDALVLGLGAIAGGWSGAAVARRLGRETIRRMVIVIGVAMAASLAWRHP
ncbi:MAG TPA: sulfite exporter TauE/SafE family protein [Candidatus Binatia bacterium]